MVNVKFHLNLLCILQAIAIFLKFPIVWNWFPAPEAGSKISSSLYRELWWVKNKTQTGFYMTGMETDAIGILYTEAAAEIADMPKNDCFVWNAKIPREKAWQ